MENKYLVGKKIVPKPVKKGLSVVEMIENHFQAYNAGRLKMASRLMNEKLLNNDVTVGMSITGALTPAGLGGGCIVPLIQNGFVDWIVATGANLYHDTHFGLGLELFEGKSNIDDTLLRKKGVVRIYDIFFDYKVLLSTDNFYRKIIKGSEFQKEMSSSEFHYKIGKYLHEREKILKIKNKSVLSTAYLYGVPIYTSSPGDSSIGMNIAATALDGNGLKFDVNKDVNETASIVLNTKRTKGKSAVILLGGGSPKNFVLQTEPQIQEVLGIVEKGHDYFIQITDARPDTGGLSGATPSEAVSWGKIDPNQLPDTVVVYTDITIALPILTSYVLTKHKPRKHKKIIYQLPKLLNKLKVEYFKVNK